MTTAIITPSALTVYSLAGLTLRAPLTTRLAADEADKRSLGLVRLMDAELFELRLLAGRGAFDLSSLAGLNGLLLLADRLGRVPFGRDALGLRLGFQIRRQTPGLVLLERFLIFLTFGVVDVLNWMSNVLGHGFELGG